MFVTLYSITDQISLPDCLLFEILGYMFIVINYCLVCDVTNFKKNSNIINFEVKLDFLINPIFYITKKSGQKCKYLKNEKSLGHGNKKHFSSLLKSFQLSEIISDPRVGHLKNMLCSIIFLITYFHQLDS